MKDNSCVRYGTSYILETKGEILKWGLIYKFTNVFIFIFLIFVIQCTDAQNCLLCNRLLPRLNAIDHELWLICPIAHYLLLPLHLHCEGCEDQNLCNLIQYPIKIIERFPSLVYRIEECSLHIICKISSILNKSVI